jgi:hypothetical protein
MSKRTPQGDLPTKDDFVRFLSSLFASEPALAHFSVVWNQSELGAARHKWMEHRIATGHTPVAISARN